MGGLLASCDMVRWLGLGGWVLGLVLGRALALRGRGGGAVVVDTMELVRTRVEVPRMEELLSLRPLKEALSSLNEPEWETLLLFRLVRLVKYIFSGSPASEYNKG